jgi:hypothetical protein
MVTGNIEKMEVWDRATFLQLHDDADGMKVLEGLAELGL